ncbi:hypothetical protein D5086_004780 [Populus alba]|uniref:Uncharacterized protein n=1 Tax=Populus alba TaxID=43335 RepID=A0ACC4CRR6_POPAL
MSPSSAAALFLSMLSCFCTCWGFGTVYHRGIHPIYTKLWPPISIHGGDTKVELVRCTSSPQITSDQQ